MNMKLHLKIKLYFSTAIIYALSRAYNKVFIWYPAPIYIH